MADVWLQILYKESESAVADQKEAEAETGLEEGAQCFHLGSFIMPHYVM